VVELGSSAAAVATIPRGCNGVESVLASGPVLNRQCTVAAPGAPEPELLRRRTAQE
jgi:hypothetical protein